MNMILEKLAQQGYSNSFCETTSIQEKMINLRKQNIREIMSDFIKVDKRLEYIASVCGIDFINDSNAHSLNATWYSLENIHKPIIWIVNNLTPSPSFNRLIPLIQNKVKTAIILSSKPLHWTILADHVERIYQVEQIEKAVNLAYVIGTSGDAVLFSPANNENTCFNADCKEIDRFATAVKQL